MNDSSGFSADDVFSKHNQDLDALSMALWKNLNRHERRRLYAEMKRENRKAKKREKKAKVR